MMIRLTVWDSIIINNNIIMEALDSQEATRIYKTAGESDPFGAKARLFGYIIRTFSVELPLLSGGGGSSLRG